MPALLPNWLVSYKPVEEPTVPSPDIPGLSAPIPIDDVSALRVTLSNASNRSFPGCRHAEDPRALKIALSYQHDMASSSHRFPIDYLLKPLLNALQTQHVQNVAAVQLWVDGLMPYQDLTGQQWFEVGMNPYADYCVMSIQDDAKELSNRLWIRLERTLARLETNKAPLHDGHMMYVRATRDGREGRLHQAAVEILTRVHDVGKTYWIDDKDRLYEWALSILHLDTDICNLADIVRACAMPGTTYLVNVPGLYDDPNTVIRRAFNLEGRLLEVNPNVKIFPCDNEETNEVNVHVFVDEMHLLLHAKHRGRRIGTRFGEHDIMDSLVTTVPRSRFIGDVEKAIVKQLNSYLRSGSVTMDDVVNQDKNIRRLHNMKPIGKIFCSDKRGRLLWKYAPHIFVSYSSRAETSSTFGTLNMIRGSTLHELPHKDGGAELLTLASDLSVPAEISALAVHDYGMYEGNAVIELAHMWGGGRKRGSQARLIIEADQNHPGGIAQVNRKTYLTALYLGVMERKGLAFSKRIQAEVRELADHRFYGKMASRSGKYLSTRPISRNVGAFLGAQATNWQIITAVADRMYHFNDFLFLNVSTYRTRVRGLDICVVDQNARSFVEAFVPRGTMIFLQVILTVLDLFMPRYWVHGLAFALSLYALVRAFASPGRNNSTVYIEALIACLSRVLGKLVPLITSIGLDYYFYSGRDYSTFSGGLSFRRSHLLHAINNLMEKLNTYRWKLLTAETAVHRVLKRRKQLRKAVIELLQLRDVSDSRWLRVLGLKANDSEPLRATADELAAVGVFVAETTTGDIVLASAGQCVGKFTFRNRQGDLFFQPWSRDEHASGPPSLTGRLIVGDVVILPVAQALEGVDDNHTEDDSTESSGHREASEDEIDISSNDPEGQFAQYLAEQLLESACESKSCKMQ